jgi:hypothetical protein
MTKLKPTIDLGYPTEGRGPIPSFNNIEEEAEWWDTHDAEGYPVEFEPVQIEIRGELAEQIRRNREETDQRNLTEELILWLDPSDRAALTKYANRKGIGPSTLVRMWIKEHLQEEAAREAKAS